MLTIIDRIGWKRKHVAVFKDNERVEFIETEDTQKTISEIRQRNAGEKIMELSCSPVYKEFVCVNDFPTTLEKYWKTA